MGYISQIAKATARWWVWAAEGVALGLEDGPRDLFDQLALTFNRRQASLHSQEGA